ncbi:hypothetical protein ACFQE1_03625, partial [Halobium palmae]
GVDEASVLSAIATALDGVRDRLATGRLVVADEHARDVLEQTESVVYTPEGTWVVTFDNERFEYEPAEYRRSQLTVPASQWTDADDTPGLPQRIGRAFDGEDGPERWRTCKRAWEAIATVGEPPAVATPLSEATLREEGRVPQHSADVDEFEEIVREADTVRDVRRAVSGSPSPSVTEAAVQALDLAEELDGVE